MRTETPEAAALFLVAGPYEFLPQNEFDTVPSLVFAPDFIKAYEMLGYDRVYITPAEQQWFEEYGKAPLPDSFRTLGDEPLAEVVEVDGVRVGVVGFPVPPKFFEPTQADVDRVVSAARSLRDQSDIIVGISPWGRTHEDFYLLNAEPVIDLLLGTGAGAGMRGLVMGDGRTFYVRSLTKGKYMVLVDAKKLPKGHDNTWKTPETIDDKFVELDVRIPDDSSVRSLFEGK